MKLGFDQANAGPGMPTEVSVAYSSWRSVAEWEEGSEWSIHGNIQDEKFSSKEELFQKAETFLTPSNLELLKVCVDFHVHQEG